jgi:hypothetical protein
MVKKAMRLACDSCHAVVGLLPAANDKSSSYVCSKPGLFPFRERLDEFMHIKLEKLSDGERDQLVEGFR